MKELATNTELIGEADLYKTSKRIFNFDVVSGLPCGELRHFISESSTDQEILHIGASNEREAVAIAQGSWLASKNPVLYMQNSGLFESSNDLGSLLMPCKVPTLFVVSWRGAPGENATQHFHTGATTVPLLEAFGLPYVTDPTENKLFELKEKMEERQTPGFILVKRERFNDTVTVAQTEQKTIDTFPIVAEEGQTSLSREDAIDSIFEEINHDDAVISSTGLISRSIYQNHDSDSQFYNAGAFGLTSLIGLGFALNKPNVQTFVVEGDGSVLTNLSSINTIANFSPKNFTHIVLDNKVYASCSGERTPRSDIIPLIARDTGYKKEFVVYSRVGIERAIKESRGEGPSLIDIQINTVGARNFKRPLEMDQIARRFRTKFSKI